MRMAREVDALAMKTPGKKSLAIQAFAKALRSIPTIIADNAGLDASEIIANLRAAHSETLTDKSPAPGIDVNVGAVGDMKLLGIYESFRVKNQVSPDPATSPVALSCLDAIIRNRGRRDDSQS